jgi:hypothetical protein
MDPIGNPFVREFAQRTVVRFASGAGVAGLIAGLLLGAVWQRRRTRRRRRGV